MHTLNLKTQREKVLKVCHLNDNDFENIVEKDDQNDSMLSSYQLLLENPFNIL